MGTTTVAQDDGAAGPGTETRRRFGEPVESLTENVSRTVVASEESVRSVLLALVAQGHLLLEDAPGVGKTLMAKTLARSISGSFSRVQCTPDLLPSDITGTSVFNMHESRFEFKPGPVFSNILLADEINRTGPRTQSALLEAMAEFQVSADGEALPLPKPFMVIATQNMLESHGIFALPDSQLDRFLIRTSLGLPSVDQEVEILSRAEHGLQEPSAVVSTDDVVAMQEVVRRVNVALPLKEYLAGLAKASREHPLVSMGISPRGTVLLQQAAQGWAAFEDRNYIIPEDVKRVAPMVVSHRIFRRPGSEVTQEEIVQEILETVPVPL